MTTNTPIQIDQWDREAAADLMLDLFTGVPGLEGDAAWAEAVRRGEDDDYPIVQAFTRHRTADAARIAELEGEVARLREALEAIKKADTRDIVKHGYCFYTDEKYSSITGQRFGPCAKIATAALGGQS